MRAIAVDEEQVAFWRRHTHLGVALCVVIPAVVVLRTLTVPDPPHRGLVLGLAGGTSGHDLLQGVLTLVLATGTCAFASYNHVVAYRRTAASARQIAVLAERDGLTGCLNHRTFHARLQAEALVAHTDRPLCLLVIDVDSFKTVNDTYGHPAGDEFALLLPVTTRPEAVAVGERLLQQVRERAVSFGVTVSIGVATTTVRTDGTGLLAAADLAVYRAKRAGRDRLAGCEGSPGQAVPPSRRAPA